MSQTSMAEELKKSLISSVSKAGESEALKAARVCLEHKVPIELLLRSISQAFRVIGTEYEKGVYYLPELIFAGTVAHKVLDILSPMLGQRDADKRGGKVVIGTVRGDLHDLGKNIVSLMLRPSGFRVADLGTDVAPERFVEAVLSEGAQILCMSSLLSTTRDEMRLVVRMLKERGLRDKVKVLVGGGAVDARFAEEIGADAYGTDAIEAVKLCESFARR